MTTMYNPNIVDWARQSDPDGSPAIIAELLSQCNSILKDSIHKPGNLPLGHKVTVRTGLPQGTWRQANQGVVANKGTTAQIQFGISELMAYGKVDKSIAELNGDVGKFRFNQDMATIEGLSQQMASALFYSSEAASPTQFNGLSYFYSTVSTSTAQIAENVLDMGGTGSANASLWLVGWGDRSTYNLFPKGSPAGLQYEDKGDLRELFDSSGNPFEGYTSVFKWKTGLAVEYWRFNVRMANIDTTTAGLQGVTPPDLFAGMAKAVLRLPNTDARINGITETDAPGDPVHGNNFVFYCNRTVREFLDIQAIRDKNVLIGPSEYAGKSIMEFRGVPIKVVDALTNGESRVV